MNYSFNPEAKEEFFEAISYFEKCRSKLGLEFSKEVFSTTQRIINACFSNNQGVGADA